MGEAQRAPREIKGGFEAERMILMNLSSASRKKNLNTLGPAEQQTGGRYLNMRDVVLSTCKMLQVELRGFEVTTGCSFDSPAVGERDGPWQGVRAAPYALLLPWCPSQSRPLLGSLFSLCREINLFGEECIIG